MKIDNIAVVQSLVNDPLITFRQIETQSEWQQLGRFRRDSYFLSKPYMIGEIDENGLDVQDEYGAVYSAWRQNEIIGTIRLCPFPFESDKYIERQKMREFLGPDYHEEYLEWSRLLISPQIKFPGLLPAIIIFAGLQTLANTPYKKYFGYSTVMIRRLFSRFLLANEFMEFQIPHRGDHCYTLLKGDFLQDLNKLLMLHPCLAR